MVQSMRLSFMHIGISNVCAVFNCNRKYAMDKLLGRSAPIPAKTGSVVTATQVVVHSGKALTRGLAQLEL
jgi:hypothetical protein